MMIIMMIMFMMIIIIFIATHINLYILCWHAVSTDKLSKSQHIVTYTQHWFIVHVWSCEHIDSVILPNNASSQVLFAPCTKGQGMSGID